MRDFLLPSSRERVKQAIAAVEARTSAELVVALRRSTLTNRDGAYVLGFALALASLCALLFLPQEFELWVFPLDVTAAFVLGTAVGWNIPRLRTALVSKKLRGTVLTAAARGAFVELAIHRTRGRTGILVFVSAAEREVEVVADLGVPLKALGPPWETWVQSLRQAVRRADFSAFIAGLESAGPLLSAPLPRALDDANELEDAAA